MLAVGFVQLALALARAHRGPSLPSVELSSSVVRVRMLESRFTGRDAERRETAGPVAAGCPLERGSILSSGWFVLN